jgi:hypothetical protein
MTAKIVLSLTLAFASCSKASPAEFWRNYRTDLLIENSSDQGPYGGHRAIHWKATKSNTFTATSAIDFAIKNNWKLVDSLDFSQDQTSKWTYHSRPIFPLTSTGFTESVSNDTQLEHFPRPFGGKVKVYKFRTGWVILEPGTD